MFGSAHAVVQVPMLPAPLPVPPLSSREQEAWPACPPPRDGLGQQRRYHGRIAMADAYICDFVRTPIGRYGGVLKDVRTDDLAAHPIRVLRERNPSVDWDQVDDVIYGCANQAGEDNRNVARMAAL